MTKIREQAPNVPARIDLRYWLAFLAFFASLIALSSVLFHMLEDAKLDLPGRFVQVSMLILFAFLLLLVLRYLALLWFSFLNHMDDERLPEKRHPLVTILVPAYNEGAVIQGSIESLLHLVYPHYEVIVIDDGSSDDTYRKAVAYEGSHGRANVRVITKTNGGKSRALNTGIENASGDFILCMDGDSALHPATLRRAIRHLVGNRHVAAVAGSVKVRFTTGETFESEATLSPTGEPDEWGGARPSQAGDVDIRAYMVAETTEGWTGAHPRGAEFGGSQFRAGAVHGVTQLVMVE